MGDVRHVGVVDLNEYRRQQAPARDRGVEPADPVWLPRQARALSAGEVSHRARMLKHLGDVAQRAERAQRASGDLVLPSSGANRV